MPARTLAVLLATLLLACGGGEDTATGADTAGDTATSSVTAEDCTAEQVFANACTGCGPTDACTGYEAMCLETCAEEQDGQTCADGGFCMSGVCLPVICG